MIRIFLFVLLAFFLSSCQKEELKANAAAPNIKLYCTDKKMRKLDEYLGKVVMIRFWQEGCVSCLAQMPDINEFYKNNIQNLVVFGVFMGQNEDYAKKMQDDLKLEFPMCIDELSIATKKYKVQVSPTSFIVNRDGKLVSKVIGDTDLEGLYKKVMSYF